MVMVSPRSSAASAASTRFPDVITIACGRCRTGVPAISVAQKLVIHHRRAGGQSQHSALLEKVRRDEI